MDPNSHTTPGESIVMKFDTAIERQRWSLIMRVACALVALLLLLVSLIFVVEWMKTGPFASQETIDEYHFGSEAMRAHGGRKYESSTIYSTWIGIEALVLVVSALLIGIAAAGRKRALAVVGLLSVCALVATNWVLG